MIRSLLLFNAGPFKGKHRVDLRSMAYAITARYESDHGRSNWGGKSFLVEMIDFALTGKLKASRKFDADGWITKGERAGFVGVELEDGTAIVRSRRHGNSTQIRFTRLNDDEDREEFFRVMSIDERPPAGCAAQADAEAAMLKYLAFDADDFKNVAYFESKQMARLIHTVPEKRLDIIRGWLGIEKAERAEEMAQADVTATVRKANTLRARRAVLVEKLAVIGEPTDAKVHEEHAAKCAREIEKVRAEIDSMREQFERIRNAQSIVKTFEAFVASGKRLAAEVEKLAPLEQLESNLEQATAVRDLARSAHDAAKRELQIKQRVSLGMFDGKCPVADIQCPATKRINDDRDASRAAFERAKTIESNTRRALDENERDALQCADEFDEAREKIDELKAARAEAREIADTVKSARKLLKKTTDLPDEDALYERERALLRERDEAMNAAAQVRADNKHHEILIAEQNEIDAQLADLGKRAAVAIQTRAVFRSTQRRVAERTLERISADANRMLLDAHVDLSVSFRWEYEGKNLASACEDCGAAFPKSAKIKMCDECGAMRGQNIIRRLDVERSDQSDGADDLSGVALQLAAGSWLLGARQSPWATAILDEPFAAVDKSNRKAMAGALVRLLGLGTWRQALMISHSSDTADAFPGRIEIVIAKDGTRHIRQP